MNTQYVGRMPKMMGRIDSGRLEQMQKVANDMVQGRVAPPPQPQLKMREPLAQDVLHKS